MPFKDDKQRRAVMARLSKQGAHDMPPGGGPAKVAAWLNHPDDSVFNKRFKKVAKMFKLSAGEREELGELSASGLGKHNARSMRLLTRDIADWLRSLRVKKAYRKKMESGEMKFITRAREKDRLQGK